MRTQVTIAACLAIGCSGCASTINALTNRPITSDLLDEYDRRGTPRELNKLKSVSGDRRLVRVQVYSPTPAWTICAETQADAIAARGAQSALTVNNRGSAADQSTETLLLTNARSEVSDVVRQLGWQICNAHLNGAYEAGGYARRLDKLQHDAMAVLLARSKPEKPEGTPKAGTTAQPTLAPPLTPLKEAPCVPTAERPCPKT